jgi:septal ring-binding cell division protein DamX
MTGNPLQDMLIQQFNTGQGENEQANLFALGEDARVGGTGRNQDQGTTAPTRQAQSLSGGGLWWGQDKDTFSGFDASKQNATGAATVSPAAPPPAATAAPAAPAATPAAAPAFTAGQPGRLGGMYQANVKKKPALGMSQPTPMAGMMQGQFSSPSRNRASYF